MFDGQSYYLIAAKQLASSQQVLGHYLAKLIFYSVFGVVLSTLLAWLMGHYVLRSIRQLIHATQQVNIQQLDKRIELQSDTVEVQHLTHAMNTMLADIQKGYEKLSRFSEDISHEFRTLLNNLMGQTQITLSQSRNVEGYENLLYSHLEGYERLGQMIENILFIAWVEHGGYPIEKHEINLQSMLNDLLEYFELLSEEKNMKIHLRMSEGLMVFAHMELLQRTLANLLSNAICYGHMQGEILIEVRTTAQAQIIEMTTVGVAIAEQHLTHLFERFYQIDPSRHQKAQTGGLGLAIVDSIMQLHQGDVAVQNSLKSVAFKLYLPV